MVVSASVWPMLAGGLLLHLGQLDGVGGKKYIEMVPPQEKLTLVMFASCESFHQCRLHANGIFFRSGGARAAVALTTRRPTRLSTDTEAALSVNTPRWKIRSALAPREQERPSTYTIRHHPTKPTTLFAEMDLERCLRSPS